MEQSEKKEQREQNNLWHQGFYGAAELEFREDRDNLIFETEHNLSKEPLRMDMLIVKKKSKHPTQNPIGHLFRKYNVFEYKSPNDALSIDALIKTIGYASNRLTTQGEHNNADAIYQVSVMANFKVYEELKERNSIMCDALRLLMKDELDESRENGIKQGIEKGKLWEILSSVREGDYSEERGAEKLGISIEELEKLLEKAV